MDKQQLQHCIRGLANWQEVSFMAGQIKALPGVSVPADCPDKRFVKLTVSDVKKVIEKMGAARKAPSK